MISLSLGHLIFGYATGLFVIVLLWWLRRELFRARRERRESRRAIHCAICGTIYENAMKDPLPPCPQCGRPNERLAPSTV